MSELNVEAVLIQVRDALNRNDIKLWQEPYCVEGESIVESVEVSETFPRATLWHAFSLFQNLATILSQQIGIRYEVCLTAIYELQNTALDNLKSIDEFNKTGEANFTIH
jgi:hypothetical protein